MRMFFDPTSIRIRTSGLYAVIIPLLTGTALTLTSVCPAQSAVPVRSAPLQKVELAQDLGRMPIAFEPNVGQTDPRVDYVSHDGPCNLFLTPDAAVLSMSRRAPGQNSHKCCAFQSVALRMELLGASKPHAVAAARLSGIANYISGSNPSLWHTHVPTFGRVTYPRVYPGIDLSYYGNNSRLEYDFTVAPGSDPGRIALHFAGPNRQEINAKGQLVLNLPISPLVWDKPSAYQTVHGVRQAVDSHYVLSHGDIKIAVGRYDHSKPLVIDPVLVYATYFPAVSITGMALNSSGEVFVSGETGFLAFPTTAGVLSSSGGGPYLSRVSAGGTGVVFSTYLGFNANPEALAVDSANNSYIGGNITGDGLTTTTNALQTVPIGATTGFLVEINSTGSALLYGTYIGGSGDDTVTNIAAGAANTVVVAGSTSSLNFPVTPNVVETTYKGSASTNFVTEFLTTAANPTVFSTYLGGTTGTDAPTGIALDPATGNVYLTGTTTSLDYPVSASANQNFAGTDVNGFLSELNSTGTRLSYSTYIQGAVPEGLSFVASDSFGSDIVYVGGTTVGTFYTSPVGERGNLFVTAFDPPQLGGSSLMFATAFGGNNIAYTLTGYATDPNGVSYFTGEVTDGLQLSTDALQPFNSSFASKAQPFFEVLSNNGSVTDESTYFGGADLIYPDSIAADGAGNVYIGGYTTAQDMPTTLGVLQVSPSSASHAFLDKFTLLPTSGPQINYFSPTSVFSSSPGTVLSIFGAGFTTQTTVSFGTALASGVTHVSTTELTVPLTAAALALGSTVPVTVTNPGSSAQSFSLNLQNVDPNPSIVSFSPNPIYTSSTMENVSIIGQDFLPGAVVSVNGTVLQKAFATVTNSYMISVQIPASYVSSPGSLTITVTNPAPATTAATGTLNVVAAPVPTLTAVAPTTVLEGTTGTVLTLTGTNFAGGESVIYNGVTGSPYPTAFVSPTTLTTTIPESVTQTAGNVGVQVTSPTGVLGGVSGSENFTVEPIVVSTFSISPEIVSPGATLTGTITLASVAPTGGITVKLSASGASQPYVTFPSTVVVPAGASSVTFSTIQAGSVFSGSVPVTITATIGTSYQNATFYVSAAALEYGSGLQFFSVPYAYNSVLSSIFVSLPTTGTIASWNSSAFNYTYQGGSLASPTNVSISLGTGYWGIFPSGGTNLLTLGTPASTTLSTTINLSAGWNSIGDPYTAGVSINSLTFDNGAYPFASAISPGISLISGVLYSFASSGTSGSYQPVTAGSNLAPGQGYWIYAYIPTDMTFPLAGNTASLTNPTINAGSTTTVTSNTFTQRRHY